MAFWVFWGNVDYYDHEGRLANVTSEPLITWRVRNHRKEIKKGDTAFLWIKKGPKRGIRAVMQVQKEPEVMPEWESEQRYWRQRDTAVTWRIVAKLTHPNVHLSLKTLDNNGITKRRGTPCQLSEPEGERVLMLVGAQISGCS